MRVFVKNMRGDKMLMPCKPRTARILLRDGRAKVIGYRPFTIQLLYPTGETVQVTNIGIDTGGAYVGVAVTQGEKVLVKSEIELRHHDKTQKSISELLTLRRELRRSRRYRKTRYRKPRFLNRRHGEDWLPPSHQSRINATFFWIDTFKALLPKPRLRIEVAKFDVAKMINPDIQGVEYQQGQCAGYYDTRYFVFARDEYTCQVCKRKNVPLQTHHIVYRSNGGGNRADNLITVCADCHTGAAHEKGGILYEWQEKGKKVRQYKEPPFMNTLRSRLFSRYPDAEFTYGSDTAFARNELGLAKSHCNDAIAISGIKTVREDDGCVLRIRQFRKKKRSLHESIPRKGRKTPNTTQKRNGKNVPHVDGWYLNDKVSYEGGIGWICGFTGKCARIRDINGEYVCDEEKSYTQVPLNELSLISHNNGWQVDYEKR